MTSVPPRPKIYHITHVNNVKGIVDAGGLWSDKKRSRSHGSCTLVGISGIKQRRLTELPVPCHSGTHVGDYVPFYFCPRSIMLYILYRGNHRELAYQGGQEPIIHLQADMMTVIDWAAGADVRWAFSDRNAGIRFAQFYASMADLDEVNWKAVSANDFRDPLVKEGKQAEFLVYEFFPWRLVEKVGVMNDRVMNRVEDLLAKGKDKPVVSVERSWYY